MSIPCIKPDFILDIKKDEALKLKLAEANECKISTIDRWLREKNETLTTVRNLTILKGYFGVLKTQDLLEGIPLEEAA